MKKSSKNAANVLAGLNLKYFMEINGITIEELAKSFGIKPDAVKKILDGTNAISGRYNCILLEKYHCDLNFIYGGIAYYDVLVDELCLEKESPNKKKLEIFSRNLRYLAEVSEFLDQL